MAGAQGPELAIAACKAGGLGSLPAAMLTPDRMREQIAAVRRETDAPFNVNFFCHADPAPDPQAETRWRDRLSPYYAEAGIDPSAVPAGQVRAPFDAAVVRGQSKRRGRRSSAFISACRPLSCFRASKRPARSSSRPPRPSPRRAGANSIGVDAVIAQGREAGGHRGMFLSGDIDAQPGLISLLAPSARRRARAGRGGRRHRRRARDRGGLRARRRCGPDRHRRFGAPRRPRFRRLHRAALASARDDATRLTHVFTWPDPRGASSIGSWPRSGPMSPDAPRFPLAAGAAAAPLRAAAEQRGSGEFSPLWAARGRPPSRGKRAPRR